MVYIVSIFDSHGNLLDSNGRLYIYIYGSIVFISDNIINGVCKKKSNKSDILLLL